MTNRNSYMSMIITLSQKQDAGVTHVYISRNQFRWREEKETRLFLLSSSFIPLAGKNRITLSGFT